MKRILEPEVMDTVKDSEAYDTMNNTEVNAAFVARIIQLGASEECLLDLGTGPAQIPIFLAQRCPKIRIIGVDLSVNMLKLGEKHIAAAGLTNRISLEHVDAKNLPYPKQSFFGVVSNSIIHHLPDPMPALREISRVLHPGGLILIRDLIRPETLEAATALVEKYAGDNTSYQKKLFYDSFLASFTVTEVENMLAQVNLPGAVVVQSADRHWSIECPSLADGAFRS